MKPQRAVFIGGPDDGMILKMESDPPTTFRTSGAWVMSAMSAPDVGSMMRSAMPVHVYYLVTQMPFTKTYIYDYQGQQ